MSWSDSLIKLATYEVENRQLRLAEIAKRRADAEIRLAVLCAEGEAEAKHAERDAEALEHWVRAIECSPDEADAHAGKAAVLMTLGKRDEAAPSYRTAASLSTDFLSEEKVRQDYAWPERAIATVRPLLSEMQARSDAAGRSAP